MAETEIEQIKYLLFRHKTFTKQQFVENIHLILNLEKYHIQSNEVKTKIKNMLVNDIFDIEMVHHNIQHNQNIQSFSDAIINIVDDLVEQKHDHSENKEDNIEEDFIKRIYKAIAHCFSYNDAEIDSIDKKQGWTCCNCGNYNHQQQMKGKIIIDLTLCVLCGLAHIDCIVLKIRNDNTFIMVNIIDTTNTDDTDETDYLNTIMNEVINKKQIDLTCLRQRGIERNKPCKSILRLGRCLIKYKNCLQMLSKKTKGKHDIESTTKVDIAASIDSKMYQAIFLNSAKLIPQITQDGIKQLQTMVYNKADNIADVKTFLTLKKKAFNAIIKKHTEIKACAAGKLYKEIYNSLTKKAFWLDINISVIDHDFCHIMNFHVNDSKIRKDNVFRFFEIAVHYEDSQIDECRSVIRRRNARQVNVEHSNQNIVHKDKLNILLNKNIWELNQYYIQNDLDVIHSYLVHSGRKQLVKKHDIHDLLNEITEEENKNDAYMKYVSDFDFGEINEYQFGEEYKYHELKPIYDSLHDEIVYNEIYSLTEGVFDIQLMKAIRKRKIALHEFMDTLICKHYETEYGLVRNDPIGTRHIFAIITYSDMTQFCTSFRATYRNNDNVKKAELVREHCELYNFSRALY
eukprot:55945_1